MFFKQPFNQNHMKNLLIVFVALFFISHNLSAQVNNVYIGSGASSLILQSTGEANPAGFNDLYMNPEWKTGTIITQKNTLIQNLGLRYNVTSGQFEVVSMVNPELVSRINLDGKVFIYTSYVRKGKIAKAYFQLLSEGETRLLLARKVDRKAGKKGLYGFDPFQTISETYFLQKGDKPAVEIKRNKKSILNQLSDKRSEIEIFIHENNLNLYSVKDIGSLLKYYDTILTN